MNYKQLGREIFNKSVNGITLAERIINVWEGRASHFVFQTWTYDSLRNEFDTLSMELCEDYIEIERSFDEAGMHDAMDALQQFREQRLDQIFNDWCDDNNVFKDNEMTENAVYTASMSCIEIKKKVGSFYQTWAITVLISECGYRTFLYANCEDHEDIHYYDKIHESDLKKDFGDENIIDKVIKFALEKL